MFIAIITGYFSRVQKMARVGDRWKSGMTDLSYDVVKGIRSWFRRNVKTRCRLVCHVLMCGRHRGAPKRRAASGAEIQIEVHVAARIVCVCVGPCVRARPRMLL